MNRFTQAGKNRDKNFNLIFYKKLANKSRGTKTKNPFLCYSKVSIASAGKVLVFKSSKALRNKGLVFVLIFKNLEGPVL